MNKQLIIENYLKGQFENLTKEQVLSALYRWYGARNLLTEELYNSMIKDGLIKPIAQ